MKTEGVGVIRLFLILGFLILAGCSSVPMAESGLPQVHSGMDKGQVVELAGGPQREFREKSQDHWIYDYIDSNEDHMEREVVFSNGLVISVGPLREKHPFPTGKSSEDSEDLPHFEKKMRQEIDQDKPKGEFKDID